MGPGSNGKIGFALGVQPVYEHNTSRVSMMKQQLYVRKYSIRCCGSSPFASGSYTVWRYSSWRLISFDVDIVTPKLTQRELQCVVVKEEIGKVRCLSGGQQS